MIDNYDFEEYEKYYRLRSNKKERVILHSDLNNFFASVECLFENELKNVPLAICGDAEARHGIVLAKNEIAKKYGIKTGEMISKAVKKCPFLVTRPCRYDEYVKQSRRVREVYLSFATKIESFGIDEAWIDITELALRENKGNIFEAGVLIAERIRERVKNEIGLTVSVGVSFNKTFAKLASDLKKPDAVTLISYDNFKEKVWKLPADNLLFVGSRMAEELKRLKIETIGDIAAKKRFVLKKELGKVGETIWDRANGFDFSPVSFYNSGEAQKSVSQSTTMPYDVTTYEEAFSVIGTLSDSVSKALREKKVYSKRVKLFVRYSDFTSFVRQEQLPLATTSSNDIFVAASRLFKNNVDFSRPVRAIGVGGEDFFENVGEQISFFADKKSAQSIALDSAITKVKLKYGENVILRASVMKNNRLSDFNKKHVAFNSGF